MTRAWAVVGLLVVLALMGAPEAEAVTLPFDPEPLSVYQGTVTLTAEVEVPSTLGVAENAIPLRVRYQACSDRECLAPAEVKVDVSVNK